MQSPVQDPLTDRLVVSIIAAALATAAGTVTSATKTPASMPLSAAAVLSINTTPVAGDSLTVVVNGRNTAAEAWAPVATFAAATNASHAEQRLDIATPKAMYQAVATAAGTLGATATTAIGYVVALVGTDVYHAPIVQS